MDPNIAFGVPPTKDESVPNAGRDELFLSFLRYAFQPKVVEPPAAIRTCGIDFGLPDPLNNGMKSDDLKSALFYVTYANNLSPVPDDLPDRFYRPFMAFVELVIPSTIQLPGGKSLPESQFIICRRIKQAMVTEDNRLKPEFNDFYQACSAASEVNARHASVKDLDGHVDWISSDADPDWDSDVPIILKRVNVAYRAEAASESTRCSLEFIHALCTKGQTTEATLERYKRAASDEYCVQIELSVDDVEKLFWSMLRIIHSCDIDMRNLVDTLERMFPEERCATIYQTIKQAYYAGASGLVIINDAMVRKPMHPVWKLLLDNCPSEVERFASKIKYLAENPFAGYGKRDVTEIIKKTDVPNLLFAAICIKRDVLGDKSIAGYKFREACAFYSRIKFVIDGRYHGMREPFDDGASDIVSAVTDMNQFGMLPTK